jgi:hypothetical protein
MAKNKNKTSLSSLPCCLCEKIPWISLVPGELKNNKNDQLKKNIA